MWERTSATTDLPDGDAKPPRDVGPPRQENDRRIVDGILGFKRPWFTDLGRFCVLRHVSSPRSVSCSASVEAVRGCGRVGPDWSHRSGRVTARRPTMSVSFAERRYSGTRRGSISERCGRLAHEASRAGIRRHRCSVREPCGPWVVTISIQPVFSSAVRARRAVFELVLMRRAIASSSSSGSRMAAA